MTRRLLSIGLAALLPFCVQAQDGWHDMQGNPVPDSDSAKSRDGFGAMLVMTPDEDWQEKWNTPPETVPHFSESRQVGQGGRLFILTFITNPALDDTRATDVACDFRVLRPDGSASVDERGLPCFNAVLQGDPRSVYLSAASMTYVAEPADLRGTWQVFVDVRDRLRGVELPLRGSFEVQ